MAVYERIQADDVKQASIIMRFVYQAAVRDENSFAAARRDVVNAE